LVLFSGRWPSGWKLWFSADAVATLDYSRAVLLLGALLAVQGCYLLYLLGARPYISFVVTACEVACSALEVGTTWILISTYSYARDDVRIVDSHTQVWLQTHCQLQ
jgi:hypothetical protein